MNTLRSVDTMMLTAAASTIVPSEPLDTSSARPSPRVGGETTPTQPAAEEAALTMTIKSDLGKQVDAGKEADDLGVELAPDVSGPLMSSAEPGIDRESSMFAEEDEEDGEPQDLFGFATKAERGGDAELLALIGEIVRLTKETRAPHVTWARAATDAWTDLEKLQKSLKELPLRANSNEGSVRKVLLSALEAKQREQEMNDYINAGFAPHMTKVGAANRMLRSPDEMEAT